MEVYELAAAFENETMFFQLQQLTRAFKSRHFWLNSPRCLSISVKQLKCFNCKCTPCMELSPRNLALFCLFSVCHEAAKLGQCGLGLKRAAGICRTSCSCFLCFCATGRQSSHLQPGECLAKHSLNSKRAPALKSTFWQSWERPIINFSTIT